MTREEIKSMALKSEVSMYGIGATYQGLDATEGFVNRLEAFAKLVAEHERKECEKIIWDADAWIGSDAKIWIVKSIQEARRKA